MKRAAILLLLTTSPAAAWVDIARSRQLAAHPAYCRPSLSTRWSRCASPRQTIAPSAAIALGVSVVTFAPQPFWLLMVVWPDATLTRKLMGPIAPIIALSVVHLAVVLLAATKPGGTEPIAIFGDVFDPAQSQLAGMERLFKVTDFVAEEWPHVSAHRA